MLELIIGVKGTGKTKQLIELVNAALATSDGNVVCLEKGDKLRFDLSYRCRLIDTEHYGVDSADTLYGMVAGILASNHDVTDLFIDSALKICKDDAEGFDMFLNELDALNCKYNVNIVITSSIAVADASATVAKYVG